MTPIAIYEKYKIPPNLINHQLTVAAVSKAVCDTMEVSVDTEDVVTACLLHDMGNILKFNFDRPQPVGAELDDIEYWKQVHGEFVEKYGNDEHAATTMIAQDIGICSRAYKILDGIGFSQVTDTVQTNDLSMYIATYSDMRVAPHGTVSLKERLDDLERRYKDKLFGDGEARVAAFYKIEEKIFKHSSAKPEDITQSVVDNVKSELREYKISLK